MKKSKNDFCSFLPYDVKLWAVIVWEIERAKSGQIIQVFFILKGGASLVCVCVWKNDNWWWFLNDDEDEKIEDDEGAAMLSTWPGWKGVWDKCHIYIYIKGDADHAWEEICALDTWLLKRFFQWEQCQRSDAPFHHPSLFHPSIIFMISILKSLG